MLTSVIQPPRHYVTSVIQSPRHYVTSVIQPPRHYVTSVIQPPRHYVHPGHSQIIYIAVKYRIFSPAKIVTSLYRSLWHNPECDLNRHVSRYYNNCFNINSTCTTQLVILTKCFIAGQTLLAHLHLCSGNYHLQLNQYEINAVDFLKEPCLG